MAEVEQVIPLIYIGRRLSQRGPLIYGYLKPDGTMYQTKPLIPSAKIGTILDVTYVYDEETPDDVSFYTKGPKGPKAAGHVPADDARLTGWALEDKTAYVQRSQTNENARIAKSGADPLADLLSPIRAEIRTYSPERRAAAVAYILEYLLHGVSR